MRGPGRYSIWPEILLYVTVWVGLALLAWKFS